MLTYETLMIVPEDKAEEAVNLMYKFNIWAEKYGFRGPLIVESSYLGNNRMFQINMKLFNQLISEMDEDAKEIDSEPIHYGMDKPKQLKLFA